MDVLEIFFGINFVMLFSDGACILCQRDQKLDPHDDFRCKRVEEFGVPNSATPSSSSGQVSEGNILIAVNR